MALPGHSKFMADGTAAAQPPKYKEFLFDGTVTFYIGPNNKSMKIHKKLLASISPEFDKHVNNDLKEGIDGIIHLPDEEEEVLTLFTEWAYTGDYTHNDDTLLANIPVLVPAKKYWYPATGNPKRKRKKSACYTKSRLVSPDTSRSGQIRNHIEPNQDPWPSLHKHLQLCAFSDKFNIPTLKQLAEPRFHKVISIIEPTSEKDATGLAMVIDYAYDNLPNSDPILRFLAQYASWRLELLRGTSEFNRLISTQPGFLKELLMHLEGPKTKPTALRTYLADE